MMRELSKLRILPDEMRADLDAWSSVPCRAVRRMRRGRRRRAERYGKGFVKVPQWMVTDPGTPNEVVRVYAYFALYDGKWCRKSLLDIAAELRMNPVRLSQCVQILKERKLIAYGEARKYHPTPRRVTPYGGEHWFPVQKDAVTSLTARGLRVLAMVEQSRRRRVPDPTVDAMVAVCGFWGGKPCKPSTIRHELRKLRADGWMDHLRDAVTPYVPDDMIVPVEDETPEDAVYEQPGLIPVDVIRDIVEGPLTPENDPDRFQEFWRAYPRRVGKGTARKAWAKALKNGADAGVMIAAAKQFAVWKKHTEARWIPHPATWLNAERWDDEPDPTPAPRSTTDERVDMAMEATRRVIEKYGNIDFTELHRRKMRGEIEGF